MDHIYCFIFYSIEYLISHYFFNLLFYCMFHSPYSALPEEGIIINSIGISLVALAIVVVYTVTREKFRVNPMHNQVTIRASADL